ncbi:integrating conjugative element protein, PFL_4710 family [Comamonas aquatica]|uniref:TraU family protein n=1 Tax=Comamonas aquatica TaxID=225991 RepID=UPI001EF287DE|nr:TraU family protein [Comamonas aquatica]CAB5686159.1 integrating conjugative element protein, PFL_4710 family [Comamonas aquatica]CAC9217811.1 integrating conjugative element protein, PFL_4710 family [Comamonas aquatica]
MIIRWLSHCFVTAAAAALLCAPAAASITTPGVISKTVAAAPSCLSYRVEGVCFFLYCSFGCRIRTSIKISHYVPDVVVSTFNAPTQHPWKDVGAPVASALTAAGSTITGRLLDSSAGSLDAGSGLATFKSADAIGNPAGQFAALLASGGSMTLPTTIAVPSVSELSKFASQGLPAIARSWANVPSSVADTVGKDAKAMVNAPQALMNSVSSVMKSVEGVRQALDIVDSVQQVQGAIDGVQQIAGIASSISGSGSLFCPGGATNFGLHFQSELDAPFWRGILPVEMLYAQSWVPGLGEVGNGYTQTWGNVYPRTGELYQPHPVKASAVLAERVASIIYKSAQPHIYTKVTPTSSGYRYFNAGEKRKWQMLSPIAATKCVNFGTNDSLALTSWGDGQTDSADGYAWNLWQQYTCCRRRGAYLYSIP